MRNRTVIGLVALITCVLGCDGDPLGPFEPEINNTPDTFQLQATDVHNVTATLNYTWHNTGLSANINHSTATVQGSALIVVRSSNGVTVYEHSLEPSLNEQTAQGNSGNWTIQLVLSDFSGTLNFRVEKP